MRSAEHTGEPLGLADTAAVVLAAQALIADAVRRADLGTAATGESVAELIGGFRFLTTDDSDRITLLEPAEVAVLLPVLGDIDQAAITDPTRQPEVYPTGSPPSERKAEEPAATTARLLDAFDEDDEDADGEDDDEFPEDDDEDEDRDEDDDFI